MNLASRLRTDGSTFSLLPGLLYFLASIGCGGATYSLGTLDGDGGANADGRSSAASCFSTGTSPSDCEGGSASTGSSSGSSSNGSGFDVGDAGSSGSSSDDSGSGHAGSACAVASTVACSGGATGYACHGGTSPDLQQPGLSCTDGTINGYDVDFCCFPWPAGTACSPLDGFACGDSSYAYQCTPGTLPSTLDPKLSCGTNFPDPNGSNDFCCALH